MLRRSIEPRLREALRDTPVVVLTGARQAGKSTLARTLVPEERYLTLDDATVLAAAHTDPTGFIERQKAEGGLTVIDEVQRVPPLLLAVKKAVDRERRPGRFLLTGSADVRLIPRVSEALVGRMEILTLWPLSQGEMAGRREGFLDAIRRRRLPGDPGPVSLEDLAARVVRGGFPAVHDWPEHRRTAWLRSYVTGVLERDVREMTTAEALAVLPRLVALLATRLGTLANLADVSRSAGIPHSTLQRHMALLERTFLIQHVPAWGMNLGARALKSGKLLFADTGLAAALLHLTAARLPQEAIGGPAIENFVTMELRKQAAAHAEEPVVHHFRTPKGLEVDAVVEFPTGEVVGLEVTRSRTVTATDFRGLHELARLAGRRFAAGLILYLGPRVLPFGERLHAVPLAALWQW